MSVDPTTKVEPFLKKVLNSLDLQFIKSPQAFQNNVDFYKNSILPQAKASTAIVINGSPSLGKQQFQEMWYQLPASQHQLLSYDTHLIPGRNEFVIMCSIKVRFDESGQTKLGDNAELVSNPNRMDSNVNLNRNIWGHWYGVNLNLVVDEAINNGNIDIESINMLNYRITYKPDSGILNFPL